MTAEQDDDFLYDVVDDAGRPHRRGRQTLVINKDFQLLYAQLQRYCVRRLTPREVDLVVLAGAIASADRASHRRGVARWHRSIDIRLAVHEPSFWEQPKVTSLLSEALFYGTGDTWTLSFAPRTHEDRAAFQLDLIKPGPSDAPVIPFSGGLDSQAMLLTVGDFSNAPPVLVSTGLSSRTKGAVTRATLAAKVTAHQIEIPVKLRPVPHAEQSYRTRPFLFFALAGLASVMLGSRRVFIGENGQGALGASLIFWHGEHPYQGTHPGFTYRLRRLLELVFETDLTFEHPFVWNTKAEMLRRISGAVKAIQDATSCSVMSTQRRKGPDLPAHCGACSGCILRRLALHGSGLTDDVDETYLWDDLDAETLTASRGRCSTSKNDLSLANAAVLDQQSLANLADAGRGHPAFQRVAFEASEALNLCVAESDARLERLLHAHRDEWRTFVAATAPRSWVRQLCGGRP